MGGGLEAKECLGIDVGGVIIKKIDDSKDTSFDKDFLMTPEVHGAVESIRRIIDIRFGSNVYLISKCGPEVQALTRRWLEAHFFEKTGLSPNNVFFCLKREQKKEICDALGVTHFIDDRLEVLSHLVAVDNLYLFQPVQAEVQKFSQHLDRVNIVNSWEELQGKLLSACNIDDAR